MSLYIFSPWAHWEENCFVVLSSARLLLAWVSVQFLSRCGRTMGGWWICAAVSPRCIAHRPFLSSFSAVPARKGDQDQPPLAPANFPWPKIYIVLAKNANTEKIYTDWLPACKAMCVRRQMYLLLTVLKRQFIFLCIYFCILKNHLHWSFICLEGFPNESWHCQCKSRAWRFLDVNLE